MTLDPTARPRIVVTVAVAAWHDKPELAERRNALYGAAIERNGGRPTRSGKPRSPQWTASC